MHRRVGPAVIGPVLAAGYAAAVLAAGPFHGPPLCPFLRLTGQYCPGCGSTRAAWHLLHGEVADAVRHNALVLPVLVLLITSWLHVVAPARMTWVPRWARQPAHLPRTGILGIAALFVGFGVLRNLPGLDAWLAPP